MRRVSSRLEDEMDNWNQNNNYQNDSAYPDNIYQNNGYQNSAYNYTYNQAYNQAYNPTYNQTYQPASGGNGGFIKRIINPSAIMGIISSVLLLISLLIPIIDFSVFEENVDIQYNLIKVCKNVGLISAPWTGVPYGIIIGIIAMFILSFVKIPALKLIPCFVVIAMVTIMLVDLGNIIEWVKAVLDKYYSEGGVVVNVSKVFSGIMAGAYTLAAGLIVGIISCFVKAQ